jgi:predicted N-acetyltransferase YhbS
MTWKIRVAEPDDAERLARLTREVTPYQVLGADRIRQGLEQPKPAERKVTLVVDGDGGVALGSVAAGLATWTSEPGAASASLRVHPGHRRQGIGSALAEAMHAHLAEIGARRVRVFCEQDATGFAERHGYTQTGQLHFARVDPRELPARPEVPPDLALMRLSELSPELVFEADRQASLDEPGDMAADAMRYDDWLRDFWTVPGNDLSLGVAALAGGRVASFTAVAVDGERAFAEFTGTVPEHRGRGLAKLVKSVSLRRAAAAGVTAAYTSNDDDNPPMLAINDWLGYHRVATQVSCSAELT